MRRVNGVALGMETLNQLIGHPRNLCASAREKTLSVFNEKKKIFPKKKLGPRRDVMRRRWVLGAKLSLCWVFAYYDINGSDGRVSFLRHSSKSLLFSYRAFVFAFRFGAITATNFFLHYLWKLDYQKRTRVWHSRDHRRTLISDLKWEKEGRTNISVLLIEYFM